MSTVLTTTKLMALKPANVKRVVAKCLSESRSAGNGARIQKLKAEIKSFERRYKMSTKKMIDQVCSGELAESGDIEIWLVKHNLLSVHEQKA